MSLFGGKVLPSGSIGRLDTPSWISPPKHLPYPVEIPVGSLVRTLPISGPLWSDVICIVLEEIPMYKNSKVCYPLYKVTTGVSETYLPKYALDVIAYPSGYGSKF